MFDRTFTAPVDIGRTTQIAAASALASFGMKAAGGLLLGSSRTIIPCRWILLKDEAHPRSRRRAAC
jgi:hypothetical protein